MNQDGAADHFRKVHTEVQTFKSLGSSHVLMLRQAIEKEPLSSYSPMLRKEKMPRLFQNGPSKEELAALARQRAFARDKVLGKRLADEAGV